MVRNLSYSTTESCLQKEFSNFGEISEVKLVKDEARKKSKGYAFIQYNSQEAALQALESMDQKYVDGRVIHVEIAKPDKRSYGRYPKTSGPPKEHNLLAQDEN